MTGTAMQIHDAREGVSTSHSDVDYAGLMALAKALVPTGFLPDHIKQPGQAVAIILAGRELGMPPMRALRSLRMVKGNITEDASSQLARFKADGGRADWLELTETRAEIHLVMRGGDETTSSFTMEDAKRAGLTASGSMYSKYPKAMLRSRAITQGLKDLGWEGGVGVYGPDELSVAEHQSGPTNTPTRDDDDARGVGAAQSPKQLPAGGGPAREMQMPIGHSKGKRLAEIDDRDLRGAADWCREKGKFADLVTAIDEVLAERLEAAEREQTKLQFENEAEGEQAGVGAPQDSPAGSTGPSEPAAPASGPALPTSPTIPELMKRTPSELKQQVLALLEHDALAMLRADTMAKVGGGLARSQYASLIVELTAIVNGATPRVQRDAHGNIGTLPGEYDE